MAKRARDLKTVDQFACSYLLVQMNNVQNLFDIHIIEVNFNSEGSEYTLPIKESIDNDEEYLFSWFDDLLTEKGLLKRHPDIEYWIGITSEPIRKNWFYDMKFRNETKSKKIFGLITTDQWEKSFSPPSVFEYLTITIFAIFLEALNADFKGLLSTHHRMVTKGCIYDFNNQKINRKIIIANPNFCIECKNNLKDLEQKINPCQKDINLINEIQNTLSRRWMGSPDNIDTPLYNLKKNYKYDVNRNSGYYKTTVENFRDNIVEHLPEWIIGTIITGIIGGIFVIIGLKT
jgi:hypothetical protein